MENSIRDDVNFTSMVELFGTFFEKVTNFHPQKDSLGKQLYEFKQMLYTNKSDLDVVDDYLDDLRKKTQTSVLINVRPVPLEKPLLSQQKEVSPKYQPTALAKNSKTFDAGIAKLGLKPQKFDLYSVTDFIKARSLELSNQKQSLLNRYSHVREFELDSSNFYRLIAIGTITHLIHDPNSQPRFSEIVEDVTSKRIVLKNYYYSYSHEEYTNVFCGYLEQLVQMKNAGQPAEKALELFHEMIKYDHLFNIALLCYLKGKLINFVTEILPKIAVGETQSIWDQLQSPDIAEKILNNNPMVIEPLLGVLPYLLNLKIVTQILEGGTLYERIYSKNLMNATGEQFLMRSAETSGPAIHLLIEKIFTTSNYYLLQPLEGKSLNNSFENTKTNNSVVLSDTHNTSSSGQRNQNVPSPKKREEVTVKELAIEISDSPGRKVIHNSLNSSFSRPKVSHDGPRYITDSPSAADPFKKRDLSAPRPRSTNNFTKSPRYFLTPSRLRPLNLNLEPFKEATGSEKKRPTTEFSEIMNKTLPNRVNGSSEKENNGRRSNPALRSSQVGNSELKGRSMSVNTPSGRPSLPKNPMLQFFGRERTPGSNSRQSDKKQLGDFTRQVDLVNAVITSEKIQTEGESPYDAYIKTRTQAAVLDQPTLASQQPSTTSYTVSTQQLSLTSVQSTTTSTQPSGILPQPSMTSQANPKDQSYAKTSSGGYTGITLTPTPYDNYVSTYSGRSYLNSTTKGPELPVSTTHHTHSTNTSTESYKLMTSSASTSSIQTTSASTNQANKFGVGGYFTSNSPTKTIFKGTSNTSSNTQIGYSNIGTFNSSTSATADIEHMLKDRFKNIFTLAPRTNDTPLNPFSQATKYTGTSTASDTKETQGTSPSNPYSYSSKYNLDSFKIPNYGVSYRQRDKTPVSATLKEIHSANSLQTMINTQKIAPSMIPNNASSHNINNGISSMNSS